KLIQEETRLKKQRVHSINLVNQGVDKKLKPKAKNFKKKQDATTLKVANGEKKEQTEQQMQILQDRGTFPKGLTTNANFAGKRDISKRIVLSVRLGSKRKCPGPFEKFLESHGICAQYTMLDTPQQNGVVERQNRTLMEMVRSMISKYSLPKNLWIYALRTAVYLLNRVPSKSVPKTHFDLWTRRKPSMRHLHVWGCSAEARVYNLQERKKKWFLEPLVVTLLVTQRSPKGIEEYLNNEQTPHEENNLPNQTSEQVGIALNKHERVRKSAIPNDYIVYLQETDFDIGIDHDLVSFLQAIKSDKSEMWIDAMKEELKSMAQNKV
ncbi:retrovirus-related pol polyprotein from transposon TNT 1-94, partial [Tanacetum coccineum]